ATQGVPGEGDSRGRIMLIGEQPGDQEDLAGHPFVGPAGKLLDKALAEAGIDRKQVYVTNVVKHFSWFPRGKRRMHKTPTQQQVAACLDWLRQELRLVKPRIIVCLGATAAKALLGPSVRVTVDRGSWLESDLAEHVMVAVHPSSILRVPREDFAEAYAALVRDFVLLARAG
ncbi:MAG: UdgX family uracil-DNA binding protein, partial [Betaproteobacteria bacterium]